MSADITPSRVPNNSSLHVPCDACGREDINSGSKDAHELYARDRLRRNVQWMAGVSALEPPTLSEMGKLMDKLLEKARILLFATPRHVKKK